MSRMVVAFVIAACTHAQPFRHITGVVVDADGKPMAEARIDHSGDRRRAYLTDSNGKFELDTDAPALVIRKPGFRSEWLRTPDSLPLRVTLQKVSQDAPFPSCSNKGTYTGIDGWRAVLMFPPIPSVIVSSQSIDTDYATRSYYVETNSGPKGIRHGSGPMWSLGIPSDDDVWRSTEYRETSYEFGRQPIIDGWGKLPNGNHWRYLGKFGESAFYRDVDAETARILDRVLDGLCVKSGSLP